MALSSIFQVFFFFVSVVFSKDVLFISQAVSEIWMEQGLIFNWYFFSFCPFGITGGSKEAALPRSHSFFARIKKGNKKEQGS